MKINILLAGFLISTSILSFSTSHAYSVNSVVETVESINTQQKDIQRLVQKQAQLEREFLDIEAQQKELAKQITNLQQKSAVQTEVLRERLKALYYFSEQGFWQFFFSNNSASELDRNLKIMARLNSLDIRLIEELKENSKILTLKSERLSKRSIFLKKRQNALFVEEKKLSKLFAVRKETLTSLKKKSAYKDFHKILKVTKDPTLLDFKKSGLVEVLKKGSLRDQKGKLPWPVTGSILREYGVIQDEDFENIKIPHMGILIGASEGESVNAIASGTIEFAGELPFMGPTVIIGHGDQFQTVYSGLKSLQVKKGDLVNKNQLLAKSARLGFEETSGVYFEIRQFTATSDPSSWMKGNL
jgi:septal ring factor EnvC (AmiA/AmiB activator)